VILAVDQGTTGTTCLLVDDALDVHGRGYAPVSLSTPRPGWVEQDPGELWTSVERATHAALASCGASMRDVETVGIANQRETTIVWDRRTGEPIHPAIVWQDRRTAERCRELPADEIRALTGGSVHATDVSNASRTMLLDLASRAWSDELLALVDVPRELLPEVRTEIDVEGTLLEASVRIAALAGDQQASLFAHGAAKATVGTGAFVLVESGDDCSPPPHGLVRTACAVDGYALEGSVFVATAALEWLRAVASLDSFESEVDSTEGVYFVPALTGLGSPHWRPDARGLFSGLSQRTTRAHLLRATLEAIAFQIADVVDALPERPESIGVDGGASANRFLMQFLADVLRLPVVVPDEREMTALGAAALAARTRPTPREAARYEPERDVSALIAGWRDALSAVLA